MKYSAGMVSTLFWFNETRETVKLLTNGALVEEIIRQAEEDNIYQLKSVDRRKRACRCILKRLDALPKEIIDQLVAMDISSAKIIVLISIMKTDLLFFEFVYEVYRQKIILGERTIDNKDLNLFFDYKYEQSGVVQKWSDSCIKKLKNCYMKILNESGLLNVTKEKKEIVPALLNYKVEEMLTNNNLQVYLKAVKGEA